MNAIASCKPCSCLLMRNWFEIHHYATRQLSLNRFSIHRFISYWRYQSWLAPQLFLTNICHLIPNYYYRIIVSLFKCTRHFVTQHYCDVIMGAMACQIASLTIVYFIVHSGAGQRKHQSSASMAFVRGIHRWPVNSPHKWPVTRENMFPFDDVIMKCPKRGDHFTNVYVIYN